MSKTDAIIAALASGLACADAASGTIASVVAQHTQHPASQYRWPGFHPQAGDVLHLLPRFRSGEAAVCCRRFLSGDTRARRREHLTAGGSTRSGRRALDRRG